MPRGRPQNITELNAKRTPEERKKAASKAGKASGKARREYANIRECFNEKVDSEMMDKAFDKLWRMFINKGNLQAYDRIVAFLDDNSTAKTNVTITFASQEMEEYGD